MFTTNPFAILSTSVSPFALQVFVIVMIAFVVIGTLLDIIHKKNVQYFFNNAKKAKKNAVKELTGGERAAVITKTIVHDIATTSELGMGERRDAHLLGMYGTILFWIGSGVMIFGYSSPNAVTPTIWPIIWHAGAILTCLGAYWFWFFLRVGTNSGKVAGQSINHCHIHLIPRRKNDVKNPQGGVRAVISAKQHYVRKK